MNQAWDLYCHVVRRIGAQFRSHTSLELQYVSKRLHTCTDLQLAVPGSYVPNEKVIRISHIKSHLQVSLHGNFIFYNIFTTVIVVVKGIFQLLLMLRLTLEVLSLIPLKTQWFVESLTFHLLCLNFLNVVFGRSWVVWKKKYQNCQRLGEKSKK